MFEDLRKHSRYSMFAIAKIKLKDKANPLAIFGEVSNISDTGLGIYSCTRMNAGTEVFLNIEYRNAEGIIEQDSVEGKVTWISPKDELYYVGICYDEELNPEKHPKLYRHFHEFIKRGQVSILDKKTVQKRNSQ
jgi:Tfp pilus assembly protein PilZ